MTATEPNIVSPVETLRRLAGGVAGALRTRVELLGVELEEERYRLVEVLLLGAAATVLGFLAASLLAVVIILLFPPPYRIYAAAGLFVLCCLGTVAVVLRIKRCLRAPPFDETIAQAKKDFECLAIKR